jgi:protein subunit release factor A
VPTGLGVRAEETRSQSSNRKLALGRLRMEIALARRAKPMPLKLARLNPRDAGDVAKVLDHLDAHGYVVSHAADAIGATTSALSGFICGTDELLSAVNQRREAAGLRKLRP